MTDADVDARIRIATKTVSVEEAIVRTLAGRWLTARELERLTGMSPRAVSRALRALRDRGEIAAAPVRDGRRRLTVRYGRVS